MNLGGKFRGGMLVAEMIPDGKRGPIYRFSRESSAKSFDFVHDFPPHKGFKDSRGRVECLHFGKNFPMNPGTLDPANLS
jgi:hypothetical protein